MQSASLVLSHTVSSIPACRLNHTHQPFFFERVRAQRAPEAFINTAVDTELQPGP
jgi:hypothetical protein